MTWFSSAYKALAHGAPNWDTQLRADLAFLETGTDQGGWLPTYGGDSGATVGANGGTNGYYVSLGARISYHGRILFGSSAVAGGGVIANMNLGSMNTQLSQGRGFFRNASNGARVPLMLVPITASEFAVLVVGNAGLAAFNTLGNPSQSSEIFFQVDGVRV